MVYFFFFFFGLCALWALGFRFLHSFGLFCSVLVVLVPLIFPLARRRHSFSFNFSVPIELVAAASPFGLAAFAALSRAFFVNSLQKKL